MLQPPSLFEELQKEACHFFYFEETIKKLKDRNCVYVFGAGDRAVHLAHCLEQQGVHVGGLLASRSHLEQSVKANKTCENRIFCYEEILEKENSLTICPGVSQSVLKRNIFNSAAIREVIPLNLGIRDDYLMSWDTYKAHAREMEWLYRQLADEQSKTNIIVNLQGRLTGRDVPSCPSGWSDPQYFLPDLMKWRERECLMDGGAFIGDTVEEFLRKKEPIVSKYKIYAWEPDPLNFEVLERIYSNDPNVIPVKKGMFSSTGKLRFDTGSENGGGEISSISEAGNMEIAVSTIDEVAGRDKVTFIKMDVEGSELEALKGARQQITENRPRLAVCLYHKQEDLWTIPQYIASLYPNYKFYLRPHSSMPTELTLFCVPN